MNAQTDDEQLLCFSAMAGVFPGAATIEALWQRILNAEVAPLTDMAPRWRLPREAIFAAEQGLRNRSYLDRAHCLPESALPGSAFPWGHQLAQTQAVLDELLRQAGQGQTPARLEGCALVLGTSWSDESYFMADAGAAAQGDGFDPAAQLRELAAARGLEGPALSIDTACSSFSYALECAASLLRTGQAQRAVVGGVNAFLPPTLFLGFSQLRALAGEGQLLAFGEAASGIVPGECVAAFLVEPLHEALRAGRRPLGLLRGLGISSDGAEGSVFAPGRQAQLRAYARAYEGIDPAGIDYIEAHGTGTPLGDGTEVDSLDAFFKSSRGAGGRIPIGSIKALIGHTLAAAGAASLAKTLLMLQHRTLPPHVAVRPHPRLADSCLELSATARVLAPRDRPMRIGVSSFGFGGANAHLVIEEARERAVAVKLSPAAPAAVLPLDLAVVDLEACYAQAASAHEWQQVLAEPSVAASPFPAGRFEAGAAAAVPPELQGRFLCGEKTIDIDGYRMGPKALAHVDPFKLLLTSRAKALFNRQAAAAASDDTAAVICANMGGEGFFRAYRRIAAHFGQGQGPAPDLVVNDVATMLPTMLSGYPTQILDLRGFHETISGGPGAFWSTLLAAPAWLSGRCRQLLLGAGRYFSSAADVASAAAAGSHGEGVGLFLLKSMAAARQDGNQVLATLRCVVDAGQAPTLQAACAAAGVAPAERRVEVCELSPAAAADGAQAAAGFLGEAAGVEALGAIILRPGRCGVVEVRRAGKPQFWLFVDKDREVLMPADAPVRMPLTIVFSPPAAVAAAAAPVAVAAPPLPAAGGPAQERCDLAWAAELHAQMTQTLCTSLRVRTRAIELLCGAEAAQPKLQGLRRDPKNLVLAEAMADADGWSATMRIDQTHHYFFDHPLDHVPGILLLEGVLQLVEFVAAQERRPVFVASINVRFKRYTEKDPPITVRMRAGGAPAHHLVEVWQSGQLMCECDVATAAMSGAMAPPEPVRAGHRRPHKRFLHKHREENVLVGEIEDHAGGIRVPALPLPPGHFFRDGAPQAHSMLYFLETARQSFMLLAHSRLGVPFDASMNLVELRFALERPIPRDVPLSLAPEFHGGPWTGVIQTGRVTIRLIDAAGVLGTANIVAQVLEKDIYATQRHAVTGR